MLQWFLFHTSMYHAWIGLRWPDGAPANSPPLWTDGEITLLYPACTHTSRTLQLFGILACVPVSRVTFAPYLVTLVTRKPGDTTAKTRDVTFCSVSGTPANYTNWGSNEPLNPTERQCVRLYSVAGLWGTADCSSLHTFFCEIPV